MKPKKKSICRVCLQCDLDIKCVSSIFEENITDSIYKKLNTIAALHIKPKDGLPDKICDDCLLELENAINFKQKCETSNSILLSAANIGIGPAQDDVDPLNDVKSEPEEYSDQEYLEEDVCSPPEVPVKLDPDLQVDDTDPPPVKISKAIDLKLECHDCGGSFKSKCKLKVHWKKVHLKQQLTCPICRKTFGSFKKRKEHDVKKTRRCKTFSQVNITGEKKNLVLHCKECKYSNSSVNNMTAHLVTHTGERNYACKLCPKRYSQFIGLQAHMESKHGKAKQRLCKICGELITGRMKYTSHLTSHKNMNAFETCEVCKKKIKKGGLKSHMATHSEVRSMACDKCAATFKSISGLWNHVQSVHHKAERYTCDKCGYKAKRSTTMSRHKSKHTGDNFPCLECGRFFENELQLSMHKLRHTNRNHMCSQCDASFYGRRELLRHVNKKHKTYIAFYRNTVKNS